MKRFLALTSAMVLTLTMAACTNSQSNGSSMSGSAGSSGSGQQSSSGAGNTGSIGNQDSQGSTTATAQTKTGVGLVISLDDSTGATDNGSGRAQAEVTVCAASFDNDGKIVDIMFDVAEPGVDFDSTGALTTDLTESIKTKRQLGDDYGMEGASGIGKEWYEQVDALQEWMVGQSVEEVLGMKTSTQNGAEYADEEELTSSVTIAVDQFLEALQVAYDNAEGSETSGQNDSGSQDQNSQSAEENQSSSESSANGQ